MLHSILLIPTPVSLPEKVNVTELDLVFVPFVMASSIPSIAKSMLVVGAVVSTVHVNDAGDGLIFPTLSLALTSRIWVPSAMLLALTGPLQEVKFELSKLHSKLLIPTPLPSLPPESIPEKLNIIELHVVLPPVLTIVPLPSVAESIIASGGTVSTVQANAEGGLILPTLSSTLTSRI